MKAVTLTGDNINDIISNKDDRLSVIIFDAEFTNQRDIVQESIKKLEDRFSAADFLLATCDAETHHEVAKKLDVVTLPCLVLLKSGKPVKKTIDFDSHRLNQLIQAELGPEAKGQEGDAQDGSKSEQDRLTLYIESLIKSAPVMVFMKGKPSQPRCGFSKQLMELLSRNSVEFESFDILENEEVRQGLKDYSNWPTYPQIYANGEFVGGLDILKQLEESGELKDTLQVSQT